MNKRLFKDHIIKEHLEIRDRFFKVKLVSNKPRYYLRQFENGEPIYNEQRTNEMDISFPAIEDVVMESDIEITGQELELKRVIEEYC